MSRDRGYFVNGYRMLTHILFWGVYGRNQAGIGTICPVVALEDDLSCEPLGDTLSDATRQARVQW